MKTTRPSTYSIAEMTLTNGDNDVLRSDRLGIICLDNLNVNPGHNPRDRKLEVVGGTETNPLRLNISTNYANLIILSGYVDIVYTGRKPNKVYISQSAHATISVSARQKIIIEGLGNAVIITGTHNHRILNHMSSNRVEWVRPR